MNQRHKDKAREVIRKINSTMSAAEYIIAAALAEAEGEWVRVEDGLPEPGQENNVQLCSITRTRHIGHLSNDGYGFEVQEYGGVLLPLRDFYAWRPFNELPPLPEDNS
jgi:hypothetical protein